jgi:hypothetical protein
MKFLQLEDYTLGGTAMYDLTGHPEDFDMRLLKDNAWEYYTDMGFSDEEKQRRWDSLVRNLFGVRVDTDSPAELDEYLEERYRYWESVSRMSPRELFEAYDLATDEDEILVPVGRSLSDVYAP